MNGLVLYVNLSLPKQDASIENIADTGEICDDDLDFEEYTLTIHGAEVIQVLNLQTFSASIVCKAKVEQQQQTWVHVHMWYPTKRRSLCNPKQR